MFKDKKVLVTGGTGMIGRYLVDMLLKRNANVTIASLDSPSDLPDRAHFIRTNLMIFENCLKACSGMDYVFHLAGVKGSPAVTESRPASFFVPLLTFNTNMMEAARQAGVKRYLFTSTVGVYAPSEIMREDDVWRTFPSEHDRFAGWAKRMGELQAQSYAIEYGWREIAIVRPANVYGRYDTFDAANTMVIPSLIRRALKNENPLIVWGDGSAIRDFIHSSDVARGMIYVIENGIYEPLNLGSGQETTIRELVEIVAGNLAHRPEIVWDTSKPTGDRKRLLDMTKAASYGFKPEMTLEEGIRDTMSWYSKVSSKDSHSLYNVFQDGMRYS